MSQKKINDWNENPTLIPQRLLLSGINVWELAVDLSAKLNKTNPERVKAEIETDILVIKNDGTSIKIGDKDKPERNTVRGLIKWLNQKPVSAFRIVILENLERASREALQSMLKIIEEPPSQARFIFTTQNHYQILPTILSRMTVVNIPVDSNKALESKEINDFLVGKDLLLKFKQVESLSNTAKKEGSKKVWTDFLTDLIILARITPSQQINLESIYQTQQQVNRNVNPRLALENLALQITI